MCKATLAARQTKYGSGLPIVRRARQPFLPSLVRKGIFRQYLLLEFGLSSADLGLAGATVLNVRPMNHLGTKWAHIFGELGRKLDGALSEFENNREEAVISLIVKVV
jgi:hypothetical protein